jgi:hypothetical protein
VKKPPKPRRFAADEHRASLLCLDPDFVWETHLAFYGHYVAQWQRRWSVQLHVTGRGDNDADTGGDLWWSSVYHGQGVIDVPRDISAPPKGRDDTSYDAAGVAAQTFPGPDPRAFDGTTATRGRTRGFRLSKLCSFDAAVVLLVKLAGYDWDPARIFVQREWARSPLSNSIRIGKDTKRLADNVKGLRLELQPRSPGGTLLPRGAGQYVDVNNPIAWDGENRATLGKARDYPGPSPEPPWAFYPACFHVLAKALGTVGSGSLPPITANAVDALHAIARNGTWRGRWPLSTVLSDALCPHPDPSPLPPWSEPERGS